jgi:hypothetical protein
VGDLSQARVEVKLDLSPTLRTLVHIAKSCSSAVRDFKVCIPTLPFVCCVPLERSHGVCVLSFTFTSAKWEQK